MKKIRVILIILCMSLCISLISCGVNNGSYKNPSISPVITGAEARILYESISDVVLLDVRSQEEFNEFHLADSILIPAGELESRLDELPSKDNIIIVYCKAGIRSEKAVETLLYYGFKNVYDMQSIDNWFSSVEKELLNEIDRLMLILQYIEDDNSFTFPDEDIFVPEGAKICGRCLGCGEYHFIWDEEYFDHIHDYDEHEHSDCGCNYDCHCHMGNGSNSSKLDIST